MHAPRCLVLALCLSASLAAPAQTAPIPQPSGPVSGQISGQPTASTTPPTPIHTPYPTGASTPLGETIATLLAQPGVTRAHWGIAVTTLDGTPLYGLNEGQLFRPASVAKLYTTTTAMALLGPDATVDTSLSLPAPGKDGTVTGNLIILGAGDANLSTRPLPYDPEAKGDLLTGVECRPDLVHSSSDPLRFLDDLVDKVAKAGVLRITGDVVGFDAGWPGSPYPEGWSIEDMVPGYGAPVSSLSIEDNELKLVLTPCPTGGMPALPSQWPAIGYYKIVGAGQTIQGNEPPQVSVQRGPGSDTIRVSGHISLSTADYRTPSSVSLYTTELAIADPALFAAEALRFKLEQRGIQVTGEARAEHSTAPETDDFLHESRQPLDLSRRLRGLGSGPHAVDLTPRLLLYHTSPPLNQDVTVTLKDSLNLHAELMLRRLGDAFGASGSTAEGARVVRQYLLNAGLDPNDFVFYDGSGLSTKDLVTPRATAHLLAYAATQPWFAQWKPALPVGGVDGTLEHRFTEPPLQGHIFAKTGTLGESRALAGYLDAASGRQIVFAIFSDNHSPGTTANRAVMDKIVAAIAAAE